jgi:hypothetical protein
MNIEKAKLLDQILLKFAGNITIKWSDLQQGIWNDIATYHVCENNITFLIGEGQLKRDTELRTLSMTDKGFATMTDLKNLGYAKQSYTKRQEKTLRNVLACVTIATFVILCLRTFILNDGQKISTLPQPTMQGAGSQEKDKHYGTANHAADSVPIKQDTTPRNQNRSSPDTHTLK